MSIAPNPADLPSPANRYRLPERVHATVDLFNLVFGSIGARLDAAEVKSADYDEAIDRIIGQALQTVSTALTIEIEAGRAEFEAVRDAFEELQSGGFSAARIAATLTGQTGVSNVQQALDRLRVLVGVLPTLEEGSGLKFIRSKADGSGFELAEVDLYSAALLRRVARSANTQIVKADKGKLFVLTGSFTQTVTSPVDLGDGHHYFVKNAGAGNITIPASDGRTNWIMYPGEMRLFQCDGTTLRSEVLNPFTATFTVSGNFILPPGYSLIEGLLWGAGGGGGGAGAGTGSSGGGCAPILLRTSEMATTTAFTIGAGGPVGQSGGDGGNGGSSSFGPLTVTGGGGGAASSNGPGGNGGGVSGAPSGSAFAGAAAASGLGVGNGGYGGGAGGPTAGGRAVFGGAGGSRTNSGGSSTFGGNGGVGNTPGMAPGGGGGAGADGARGEFRVWGVA